MLLTRNARPASLHNTARPTVFHYLLYECTTVPLWTLPPRTLSPDRFTPGQFALRLVQFLPWYVKQLTTKIEVCTCIHTYIHTYAYIHNIHANIHTYINNICAYIQI